ncbi:hypothetical protein FQZ97_1153690 [compost metagenome]
MGTKGKEVPGQYVLEGEDAGEKAGDEENLEQGGKERGHVLSREPYNNAGGVVRRDFDYLAASDSRLECPGSERVEDADADNGDIGCPRDSAVGVTCFVPEDGGGLKADE